MDLLEYQVKEWFGQIGIPVLPSQRIDHPTDLKRLKIPYPVVLKSQVYGGGRQKVGGVRFVETTIDAIAAAQNIFNLPILGELPEVLLAEARYEASEELYLAVVIDTAVCRPILLGCQQANIDWDLSSEKMQHVVVEQEFSPFYARQLALKMGLEGSKIQHVSKVIEKMYQLFVEKDLDLLEINPLGINAEGHVMALNGSVRVNERSIARHPDIALMASKMANRYNGNGSGSLSDWDGLELHGKIGILGNGAGSVLATMDLVNNMGGKPGICLNLRHASPIDISPTTFRSRLETALRLIGADRSIQVILINLLGSIPQATEIAQVITDFVQHQNNEIKSHNSRANGSKHRREHNLPRLVIRLAGSEFDSTKQELAALKSQNEEMPILVVENLDEAVTQAVSFAKSTATKKF